MRTLARKCSLRSVRVLSAARASPPRRRIGPAAASGRAARAAPCSCRRAARRSPCRRAAPCRCGSARLGSEFGSAFARDIVAATVISANAMTQARFASMVALSFRLRVSLLAFGGCRTAQESGSCALRFLLSNRRTRDRRHRLQQRPPDFLRPAAPLPVAPALLTTAAARAGDMCKHVLQPASAWHNARPQRRKHRGAARGNRHAAGRTM